MLKAAALPKLMSIKSTGAASHRIPGFLWLARILGIANTRLLRINICSNLLQNIQVPNIYVADLWLTSQRTIISSLFKGKGRTGSRIVKGPQHPQILTARRPIQWWCLGIGKCILLLPVYAQGPFRKVLPTEVLVLHFCVHPVKFLCLSNSSAPCVL